MCGKCDELAKIRDLVELENLGRLNRLENIALLSGGFTIPDATRDLLPHEKDAKVKFRDMFELMSSGADRLSRAIETLATIAQRELLLALSAASAVDAIDALRRKQPDAMAEAEDQATDLLEKILSEIHADAAKNALAEAKRQGRDVSRETIPEPEPGEFRVMARTLAMEPWSMMLAEFQMQVFSPSAEVSELAAGKTKRKKRTGPKAPISKTVPDPKRKVPAHLRDATDKALAKVMSGLADTMKQQSHVAHGRGRNAMARKLRPGSVFASELLDKATCKNCRSVDGKEYETLEEARADYPEGPYVNCLGGARCRGTLVFLYPEPEED